MPITFNPLIFCETFSGIGTLSFKVILIWLERSEKVRIGPSRVRAKNIPAQKAGFFARKKEKPTAGLVQGKDSKRGRCFALAKPTEIAAP